MPTGVYTRERTRGPYFWHELNDLLRKTRKESEVQALLAELARKGASGRWVRRTNERLRQLQVQREKREAAREKREAAREKREAARE
jgi:methionine salvage enolase-phosphatase E1